MARHNLCTNPALTSNATGWGGGSTPARVGVTGFGRPFAAEYTTGGYAATAATAVGAVTVGATYTVSVYVRTGTFNVNSGSIYIEWINGAGGGFGYPSATYTLTAATVGRVSVTATAPSGAVAARAIVDGINFPINTAHFTTALIEPVGALDAYFDGDSSPGGSWDGTPGNSSSTLVDAVTGTMATTLPTLDAAGTGAATTAGIQTVALPAPTASAAGTAKTSSTAAITPDALIMAAAGRAVVRGTMAAALPELVAATPATGDITIRLGPTRRRWSARTSRR